MSSCVCVCVCVCVCARARVICVIHVLCACVCPGAHGSTAIYFSSFHPSLSRSCLRSHLFPSCCSGFERTTTSSLSPVLYLGQAGSGLDFGLAQRTSEEQGGELRGRRRWQGLSLGQKHVIRLCPRVCSPFPRELLPSSSPVSAHSDFWGCHLLFSRLSPSPRH